MRYLLIDRILELLVQFMSQTFRTSERRGSLP